MKFLFKCRFQIQKKVAPTSHPMAQKGRLASTHPPPPASPARWMTVPTQRAAAATTRSHRMVVNRKSTILSQNRRSKRMCQRSWFIGRKHRLRWSLLKNSQSISQVSSKCPSLLVTSKVIKLNLRTRPLSSQLRK